VRLAGGHKKAMNTNPKRAPMPASSPREHLQGLLSELQARHQRLHEHLASEPRSADASEQAVERENDEVVESLVLATETNLSQIEKAIARIDSGSYGVCTHCGVAIEQRRLQALPQATECVDCAQLP
jgi:DnaK suppressor protein